MPTEAQAQLDGPQRLGRHVQQCIAIGLPLGAEGDQHAVVDRFLAQPPQLGVSDPDRRVVEVGDLQQRLQQVDLQVPPLPMQQLVGEDELELVFGKLAHEPPGDEDRRPPESTDGRTADLVGNSQPHVCRRDVQERTSAFQRDFKLAGRSGCMPRQLPHLRRPAENRDSQDDAAAAPGEENPAGNCESGELSPRRNGNGRGLRWG